MTDSRLPDKLATLARARVDTHASTHLPQQQRQSHQRPRQQPLQSSVAPRPQANPQRLPRSDTIAATATLPASTNHSGTDSFSPSPHSLYTSSSSGVMSSNDSPAANSCVNQYQARRPPSGVDTSRRSVSGSLDRNASLHGSMISQVQSFPRNPSLTSTSQEPPRSPCVPNQPATLRTPSQAGRPSPQMPTSSVSWQPRVTVPSQPAQPTTRTKPSQDKLSSPPPSHAHSEINKPPPSSPSLKNSVSRSPHLLAGSGKRSIAGQAVQTPQRTNANSTGQQPQNGTSFKEQQSSRSRSQSRILAHVTVADPASCPPAPSQAQTGLPSRELEPLIREAARHQTPLRARHPDLKPTQSLQRQVMQPAAISPQSPLQSQTSAQTQAEAQPIPRGTLPVSHKPGGAQPNCDGSTHPQVQPDTLQFLPGGSPSTVEKFDFESLMTGDKTYRPVEVVSCIECSIEELETLIVEQVEKRSLPLVISNLHKTQAWASLSHIFEPQGYQQRFPSRSPAGHNLADESNQPILPDFLDHSDTSANHSPELEAKLYERDLQCPKDWATAIATLVPPRLVLRGEQDVSASLGCEYGVGVTCTPLHRDLCSSLRQNLMVWCDPDASATWLITDAEASDAIERHITSKIGDLDSRGFTPHPKELLEAPFSSFCYQQKLGDLVLVPSRASYMVANTGGRNMKVAWSRMTVNTLTSALFTDLPIYQRACRREGYHVKSVIEETLIQLTHQLEANIEAAAQTSLTDMSDLCKLLKLYDAILCDEYVPEWREIQKEGGHDSYVECDFCGACILGGYFECPEGEDKETLCPLCYCQGRLCGCPDASSKLQPRQHRRTFGERLSIRNKAAQALLRADPALGSSLELVSDSEAAEALEDATLLPISILNEAEVDKKTWPLSFKAAFKLYKIRQAPGWREDVAPCRICKALLDVSQRYYCRVCKHSYCHGCFVHKLYIHPVHTLATGDWAQLHRYHRKGSTLDYKEWKQDPLEFNHEARAHFALLEAARTRMACSPINKKCRIGFLDVSVEHPHGLSGTLGMSRTSKAQTNGGKSALDQSVAVSSPVSRKRKNELVSTPSPATPLAATRKRAKLNATSKPEAMDESDAPDQLKAEEAHFVPTPAASARLQTRVTSTAPAASSPVPSEIDEAPFSAPTVANGIRRFVLRTSNMGAVSPILPSSPHGPSPSTTSSPPTPAALAKSSVSQDLSGPLSETTSAHSSAAAANRRLPATVSRGSSATAQATAPTSLALNSDATQIVPAATSSLSGVEGIPAQSAVGTAPTSVNASTSISPPQSTKTVLPAASGSLASPTTGATAAARTTATSHSSCAISQTPSSAATEPVAHAPKSSAGTSPPAPSFTTTASAPTDTAKAATAANSTLSPVPQANSKIPEVAASTTHGAKPGHESLALATKAVVAGMTATSPAPVTTTAGLASLDHMNLRVVTEVLRIFSQANQRTLAAQAEENAKAQAKQVAELEAAHARQIAGLQEAMRNLLAAQTEDHQKLQDRLEAKLLQRLDQHSSTLLQRMQSLEERLQKLQEDFNLLTEDLDRGAQIELEAMLSNQSSKPVESSHASSSTEFASTSQTRR